MTATGYYCSGGGCMGSGSSSH